MESQRQPPAKKTATAGASSPAKDESTPAPVVEFDTVDGIAEKHMHVCKFFIKTSPNENIKKLFLSETRLLPDLINLILQYHHDHESIFKQAIIYLQENDSKTTKTRSVSPPSAEDILAMLADDLHRSLLLAAWLGKEKVLKTLAILTDDKKIDFNEVKSFEEVTLLHLAAYNGHFAAVKLLVSEGKANVDAKSSNKATQLQVAASQGRSADSKALLAEESKSDFALALLNGATPLHSAAYGGHLRVVKLLLAYGADHRATTNGKTALQIAQKRWHTAIVALLTSLPQASSSSSSPDWTMPLIFAAEEGYLETVKVLLNERKANVNQPRPDGITPLYFAAQNGHIEVVKFLINESKANVDQATPNGATPLHCAAQKGHIEVVKLLVNEGKANTNQAKNDGATPLNFAAYSGHLEVVKLLLTHSADPTQADVYGVTPLQLARLKKRASIVNLLESHSQPRPSSSSSSVTAISVFSSPPTASASASASASALSPTSSK